MKLESYLRDMDKRPVLSVTFNNNQTLHVTADNVKDILYHSPSGDGDRHYVDIYLVNGNVSRDLNVKSVMFGVEIKDEDDDMPF